MKNFKQLKKRKAELFAQIMTNKYAGVKTSERAIKEYRFLQREERRMIRNYKQSA